MEREVRKQRIACREKYIYVLKTFYKNFWVSELKEMY